MNRQLGFGTPLIMGYAHHAFPLAILAQNEGYLPWFYGRYVQLCCPYASGQLDLYGLQSVQGAFSPRLSLRQVPRSVIGPRDIVNRLRDCLKRNEYVWLCIDDFYRSGSSDFQHDHAPCEILVYGYDDQKLLFHILNVDLYGELVVMSIGYHDLMQAYAGLRLCVVDRDICILRYDGDAKCVFDPWLLEDLLADYVYSRNTSERFRLMAAPVQGAFGLQVYDVFVCYCERLYDHFDLVDSRAMQILWTHKRCLLACIRFLEQEGYVCKNDGFSLAYAPLENQTHRLYTMMLQLHMTQNFDILKQIIKSLQSLARDEGDLLGCLHETLKVSALGQREVCLG